jgi:hypothetical protein
MKPTDSINNIEGGNNQILPNATTAIQYFIFGDKAQKETLAKNENDSSNVEVLDMWSFSGFPPKMPPKEIDRTSDITLCEKRLQSDHILCLNGEYGVGLSTLLSQFARRHRTNCVSYFFNDIDRIRLYANVIGASIAEQLYWYAYEKPMPSDYIKDGESSIPMLYNHVMKAMRRKHDDVMYFVFDGFDNIPSEFRDGIVRILNLLQWESSRFIFSGSKDSIKDYFEKNRQWTLSENELTRFSEADAKEYFKTFAKNANDDDLVQLYKISQYGNAHRMDIIRSHYLEKDRLHDILNSDLTGESDLYEDDYGRIIADRDNMVLYFFALLSFATFPIDINFAAKTLDTNTCQIQRIVAKYREFISINDNYVISVKEEGFHKHLKKKLSSYKSTIENCIIDVITKLEDPSKFCDVLPALYKSQNRNDDLVNYLTKDNVQYVLIKNKSQAYLNEQCDLGFEACQSHPDKYIEGLFLFAINKSSSREIEKNVLWDYEIEALLALGKYSQAMTLAQSVYLEEEKLKCYLLIARKRKELCLDDEAVLKDTIKQLVESIKFENIPDKALELAQLLFPVDYESAIGIVDRVAKLHRKDINTDSIYTLFSLNKKIDPEDPARRDISTSKIQDDDLRNFADAAKGLFADSDVHQLLSELKRLPNNSQQLHFLQYWLPEHEKKKDVGLVVLEAIRLIVADSDTEMPKARELNAICQSMHTMSAEQMAKAMDYIDSLGDEIKYPTTDYVDAMLTVIEASRKLLPERSHANLEDLYLYVDDIEDLGVRLNCLSKLLEHFDELGDRVEVERTIGSTFELGKEIIDGINKLLTETAYHFKVIEGPLKALVCGYRSMINPIIENVNTDERRSKAYSYAATQYLLKVKEDKLDLNYFFSLLLKSKMEYGDHNRPLEVLSEKLSEDNPTDEKHLKVIKKNFSYIENLEETPVRCIIVMRIYKWLLKNFPDDAFVGRARHVLSDTWDSIDMQSSKIILGFHIAKSLSKDSREESEKFLDNSIELKKNSFLSSSSCLNAFHYSIKLYEESIYRLIRLGMCDEKTLAQFRDDTDNLLSKSECIKAWGKVALEYYLANDEKMFQQLGDEHIPVEFSNFSTYDQKCIIYIISPALFLRSSEKFFRLLDSYDEYFRNACINNIIRFIITKSVTPIDVSIRNRSFDLSFPDCSKLTELLEKVTDDEIIFNTVDIIARILRQTNRKIKPLSTPQKNQITNDLIKIVETKLPTTNGIQHEGYKIASLGALLHANGDIQSKEKSEWEKKIDSINNIADRAFLYFLIGPYMSRRNDKEEFFSMGIQVAESIKFTYDRAYRLDMAITECVDNNLGSMVQRVAEEARKSLAVNGTIDEHKHFIDVLYQYKPELAEEYAEKIDNDPARLYDKQQLRKHLDSVKKLEMAGKEMKSVNGLNHREQRKFFSNHLSNLLEGTEQLLTVGESCNLCINYIYSHNISESFDAILYFMETVAKREKLSKNQTKLIESIHRAIRYNLKIVLSLASGTKIKLDRINALFKANGTEADGEIPIGGYNKAINYLLDWYRRNQYNKLIIIDPYFQPEDLSVIKQFTDESRELSISILTHNGKDTIDDYRGTWRKYSNGVKIPVKVHFVHFVNNSNDGPLHDRYWILEDEENDCQTGLKLNSISGMGNKESSITPIDNNIVLSALHIYDRYADAKVKRCSGRDLEYGDIELH